jgi:hypothetical protein
METIANTVLPAVGVMEEVATVSPSVVEEPLVRAVSVIAGDVVIFGGRAEAPTVAVDGVAKYGKGSAAGASTETSAHPAPALEASVSLKRHGGRTKTR